MSRTYKATGINIKAQVFGESDRLMTVLTRELGLIKAIAPGARKHNSSLGGRSAMFVVNELLIAKGRSLDKITQAQTIKSYPGLALNLGKLASAQYLAEIVLCQALSEHPQSELFELLNEHLDRLEALPKNNGNFVLANLCYGVFQFLTLAGFKPQVQACCLTQRPLLPNFNDPNWRVGFSVSAGGTICLTALENLKAKLRKEKAAVTAQVSGTDSTEEAASTFEAGYETIIHAEEIPPITIRLNAIELAILQQLSNPEILQQDVATHYGWLTVEQILRQYAQYHFGRPIRSAALIDSYFAANHDATF